MKISQWFHIKRLATTKNIYRKTQGCGSGSGLAPDSATLWIEIRIRIGNPDPGSRGKKIKKFQWKNALFSYF
jgi:hypothetical protein